MEGLSVERYIMDETLWLARAKVDINRLPKEFVISYTDKEYVLRYTPHNGFSEWLSDIQ